MFSVYMGPSPTRMVYLPSDFCRRLKDLSSKSLRNCRSVAILSSNSDLWFSNCGLSYNSKIFFHISLWIPIRNYLLLMT